LGAVLSVIGGIYLVRLALDKGTFWDVVSYSIFATTLVLLYLASAVYHLHTMSRKIDLILRRIDHLMIFFLIAGSYTPFCLGPLDGPVGMRLLTATWLLAAAGVYISLFWVHRPRWVATGIYLVMGWMAVFAIFPIAATLSDAAFNWLVWGGFAYSFGAVIYGMKWPDPWPEFGHHEIWHVFVLLGSFCHFMSVVNLL